jgi:protein arginine kinase activator
MICEICNKNPATVHVTEIARSSAKGQAKAAPLVQQKHICEQCAQSLQIPHSPLLLNKNMLDIWKLLQQSAQKARAGTLSCPKCGLSLAEFRSKGRLGCPHDYEIFRAHLEPLLLRVHNSTEHRGRLPGMDDSERERRRNLSSLRAKLEEAIREEAYESAARLRDQIQELETHAKEAS